MFCVSGLIGSNGWPRPFRDLTQVITGRHGHRQWLTRASVQAARAQCHHLDHIAGVGQHVVKYRPLVDREGNHKDFFSPSGNQGLLREENEYVEKINNNL